MAVIFAGVGGAIIALPAASLVFKLKGGYLAIGTWVIAEVLRLIVANIKATGGGSGITIQAATGLGTEVRVPGTYWWGLALAVGAIVVTYFLLRSRTGLALKAIRDNDLAAESSGVNLWRTKLYTYRHRRRRMRHGGSSRRHPLLRVQPAAAFSINWTAYLIFITVIGGVGTIEGPIIGTVIYFVLRETTSKYGEWYFIVLGLLAIVVTIWSPRGIYGFIAKRTKFFLFPTQRRVRLAAAAVPIEGGASPVEVAGDPVGRSRWPQPSPTASSPPRLGSRRRTVPRSSGFSISAGGVAWDQVEDDPRGRL